MDKNPYEDIVDKNYDRGRVRRVNEEIKQEHERNKEIVNEAIARNKKAREEREKRRRRKFIIKTIEKVVVVGGIAAIITTGAMYVKGSSELSTEAYDDLNASGWYVKTNVDTTKNYVASDGEVLDGNSREARDEDYERMADVLRDDGFNDAQISVALGIVCNKRVDDIIFDYDGPTWLERLNAGLEGVEGLERTGRSR